MRDARDARDRVYEREKRVFERFVPVRGEKAVEVWNPWTSWRRRWKRVTT
jgi:hypothetical protein